MSVRKVLSTLQTKRVVRRAHCDLGNLANLATWYTVQCYSNCMSCRIDNVLTTLVYHSRQRHPHFLLCLLSDRDGSISPRIAQYRAFPPSSSHTWDTGPSLLITPIIDCLHRVRARVAMRQQRRTVYVNGHGLWSPSEQSRTCYHNNDCRSSTSALR